jgi:coproporphyrinogen III oxidase
MTLSPAKAVRPEAPPENPQENSQENPQETPKLTMPPEDSRQRVSSALKGLQDRICQKLEAVDGSGKFHEDAWQRPEGGGGRSRVMKQGDIFEQGGVGFSEVWGDRLPPSILSSCPEAEGHQFYATGTSMVLHPRNPYLPTVHLNYRYFEAGPVWWFGGGIDLTPYYTTEADVIHFHKTLKDTCDRHNPQYYPNFKRWCDEYFFLKHRAEPRGVGGIFFDYQNGQRGELYRGHHQDGPAALYSKQLGSAPKRSWEEIFNFAIDCGDAFLPAYIPIVEKHANDEYGDRERDFQLYRRGRYVEFNLVFDRGTLFGLQTNGRTESILMSMPPMVRWEYDYHPEPGTPEAKLYEVFLQPQDWAEMSP